MNYKEHLSWGAVTLIIITIILSIVTYFTTYLDFIGLLEFYIWYIPTLVIAFLLGLYGSILPDVDIGTSKAFSLTYVILIGIILYSVLIIPNTILVVACLLLMIIMMTLKHRGITHQWYSAFIIGAFFGWIFGMNLLIGIYVTIGYLTHLGCDN